jgi:shikimate dehydrogenase
MQRVGLIGDPVAHSRSPGMQNAAFDALDIDARYELWPTPAADLAKRITLLRSPDVLGANVTIPHKLAVMSLLDEITPSAQAVGAVNTIINRAGRLIGHNTDADGLADALRAIGWDTLEQALVLGAGGAARAAVVALHQLEVRTICVLARDPAAAERMVSPLAQQMSAAALLWGDLHATDLSMWRRMLVGTDLIINATSLGMSPADPLPLNDAVLDLVHAGTLIMDLITRDTPLLVAARARQLPVLNGLPMLLHQGALAFTLWTGQPAPLDAMRAALQE